MKVCCGISRSKRGPGINDNEFGDHAFCIKDSASQVLGGKRQINVQLIF